jgi:alpha-L-fucosidase 2
MLMQSHRRDSQGRYVIDLLPALPSVWPTGSITGLRARGGFGVDITWKGGKLAQASITGLHDGPCTVRYAGKIVQLNVRANKVVHLNESLTSL